MYETENLRKIIDYGYRIHCLRLRGGIKISCILFTDSSVSRGRPGDVAEGKIKFRNDIKIKSDEAVLPCVNESS